MGDGESRPLGLYFGKYKTPPGGEGVFFCDSYPQSLQSAGVGVEEKRDDESEGDKRKNEESEGDDQGPEKIFSRLLDGNMDLFDQNSLISQFFFKIVTIWRHR